MLQAAFRGDVVPKGSAEDFQILASQEYGASYALLERMRLTNPTYHFAAEFAEVGG